MEDDIVNLSKSIVKKEKELEAALSHVKFIRGKLSRLKRAKKTLEEDGQMKEYFTGFAFGLWVGYMITKLWF